MGTRAPLVAVCCLVLLAAKLAAREYTVEMGDAVSVIGQQEALPNAGRESPTKLLWGDTQVHAAVKVDAGTTCAPGQEKAFRFARGEEVITSGGLRAKLSQPLDFITLCTAVLQLTGLFETGDDRSGVSCVEGQERNAR